MQKSFLYGGLILIGILVLLVVAQRSSAGDAYTFSYRGDVMGADRANNKLDVYVRVRSGGVEEDTGQVITFDTKNGRFYKYDSKNKQKKVRTTAGALSTGDEVVVRGAKKDGGNFNASEITRNDNTVSIRGTVDSHKLKGHQESGDYGILKVEIDKVVYTATGKDYRAAEFKKSNVLSIYYDPDSTKFRSREGKEMNADEMKNSNEKVTLENVVVRYGSRFVGTPETVITDDKWKF